MFRNLPSYDQYATNDSSWLGPLPSHWTTQRTKSLLSERGQKGYPEEPLLAATQSHGVIRKSDYGTRTVTASKDLHLLKLVEVGDFVISLRSFQGGIERCYHRGIISPAYTVLTAISAGYREYLTYLFKSKPFISSLTLAVTGIREGQNIDYSTLAVDLLPVPSAEEQTAIVKYLAHANARIDKAIAAKNRLIALLGELDRAVENDLAGSINAGTTDGNPIPWLGSVPSVWKPIPAKRLFKEVDRRSVTGSEGLLSLRMREGLVDANDFTEAPIPPEALLGYKIVRPGDIVMNRMRAAIGLFGVATKEGLVSPDYSTMTIEAGVDPGFFLHLFKTDAAMAEFRRRSNGLGTGSSGFMRLYYENFGTIHLPFPPLEEQRRVTVAIDRQRAGTMPVRSRVLREVGLLQEFRTRLVADVVTGQVDVRAIAATLPDAPEPVDTQMSEPDVDLEEALSESEK